VDAVADGVWSGEDLAMTGYPAKVRHLAWDPSSRWLAVANIGDVTLWDFAGKGPQGTAPVELASHSGPVTALAWHPAAGVMASGGSDGAMIRWHASARSAPSHPSRPSRQVGLGAAVSAVAWAGDHLVVALADGRVCIVE
jgi:WD40 repeat protein